MTVWSLLNKQYSKIKCTKVMWSKRTSDTKLFGTCGVHSGGSASIEYGLIIILPRNSKFIMISHRDGLCYVFFQSGGAGESDKNVWSLNNMYRMYIQILTSSGDVDIIKKKLKRHL